MVGRPGPGGFPPGGLSERTGPSLPQKIGDKVEKTVGTQLAKQLAKILIGPGADKLIGSPVGVLIGGLIYPSTVGGCDDNGNCSDMLPPPPKPDSETQCVDPN